MRIFLRQPDVIIGPKNDPYLRRWWVIPRNRFFNIYLHNIRHSDDDRALHDHPWWNLSVILSGGYCEITPNALHWRKRGSITFRKAEAAHRIAMDKTQQQGGDKPCWTIFITGPVIREWGFHCPNGWIPWRKFVDDRDSGLIGRGCGEQP
jgi:hypothetical protein